jgi:hypothetical protein
LRFADPPRLRLGGLTLLLFAEALLLPTPSIRFFGGIGREILELEHLANLDLAVLKGDALGPFDRLFDFTWISQKPAISSFVSVKGPSVTVRFSPENLTRAPVELA